MRVTIFALLIFLGTGQFVYAVDKCSRLLGGTATSNLVQDYDLRFHIVSQVDAALNHRDNACGMVCSANLMQGLRVALGVPPIADPIAHINKATEDAQFQGGLMPLTFKSFLEKLKPEFLPNTPVSIDSTWLDSLIPSDAKNSIAPIDLKSGPGTAQVLLLLPFNSNVGTISSGHWVLLASNPSASQSTIKISDPNFPRAEMEMEVEIETFNFPDGKKLATLRLTPKNTSVAQYYDSQYGRGTFFMVWSLITVTVQN